jgi:deoxycytidine triphosphate deaminase
MTALDQQEIDRLLLKEKQRLAELPYFERDATDPDFGVLLSDRIEHYCGPDFKLIWPFEKEYLRPAGYDLRVGGNYAQGGEHYTLNDGGFLTIEPYQVAVIQTLETLNLPGFLIGRWNIRVGLAYQGLLWVGGAQVDPGFRGRLSCPIYNLSTKSVTLKYGDELAMIDFVATTPVNIGSTPFQWWHKKKLVFQQYRTELQSGVALRLKEIDTKVDEGEQRTAGKLDEEKRSIAAGLKEASEQTSRRFESIQSRIDTFMTLSFTVVAVLFAGLGIIATKGSDDPSFVSSPVWVAVVALYFALRPYVIAFDKNREDRSQINPAQEGQAKPHDSSNDKWYVPLLPRPLEIVIASIIVLSSLGFHIFDAHVSAKEVRQAREQASRATSALDQEKAIVEREIQLRQQSDARLENLRQQVNLLLQNQATKK